MEKIEWKALIYLFNKFRIEEYREAPYNPILYEMDEVEDLIKKYAEFAERKEETEAKDKIEHKEEPKEVKKDVIVSVPDSFDLCS